MSATGHAPKPAPPDLDLSSPQFAADPYPVLAQARSRGPVVWHEPAGMYLTTTLDAANTVLRNRSLGRIYRPRGAGGEDAWTVFDWLHADSILDSEPPKHTRLRRLVAGAFARGHVERLRPRVVAIADELLDAAQGSLERSGQLDLLAEYAEPLPVLVVCELLGAPRADWQQLRDWSQDIVKMYEVAQTPAQREAAQASARAFADYVTQLAGHRQRHPGPDLLTSLVQERDGGDRLSERELVATVVLLLNAGHEASVNGFGNGMHSVLSTPGAQQAVLARPHDEASGAVLVEEMLRHDSPLQLFERTATADVEVAGTLVRRGEKIAALLGAANRDPAVFDEPDVFHVDRDPNPHLAFGAGIHFCIGAPLARLELQVSTRAVFDRLGQLEVVAAERRNTFVLKGFERLVVAPTR